MHFNQVSFCLPISPSFVICTRFAEGKIALAIASGSTLIAVFRRSIDSRCEARAWQSGTGELLWQVSPFAANADSSEPQATAAGSKVRNLRVIFAELLK